jgi:hypothetical protein
MLVSKHEDKADAKKAAEAARKKLKVGVIFFFNPGSKVWEVRARKGKS